MNEEVVRLRRSSSEAQILQKKWSKLTGRLLVQKREHVCTCVLIQRIKHVRDISNKS